MKIKVLEKLFILKSEISYVGFISNQLTSAIIQSTSIVWFPVPKFDSPSIFTKLLDKDGGEFSVIVKENRKSSNITTIP